MALAGILVISFSGSSYAQDTLWTRTYGGTNYEIVQIAELDAETEIRTSNWYVQAAWRSPFDIEPIARYEIYDPDEDTSGDREEREGFHARSRL